MFNTCTSIYDLTLSTLVTCDIDYDLVSAMSTTLNLELKVSKFKL